MKITDHSFTNTDAEYKLIKALLLEIENYPELDNNWEPGRMDSWRYAAHVGKGIDFFEAKAHYWKTEMNQVIALFISEYGKDDFFLVLHPDFWELFPQVLNWGLKVWAQGKTKISTDVYTYAEQKIKQLLAAGFYEDGHVENVRTYLLQNYNFSYTLKPNFKLMSFADYGNYESRVKLVQNAFNNPKFNETRLRSLHSSPNYKPELDLVIVNSQDQSIAYCMGWVEENDLKTGFIEPMGVHSNYRKNGFGTALAKECFKRLSKLGVKKVWIASDAEPNISNFLYDALNPESVKRSHKYTLKLEP